MWLFFFWFVGMLGVVVFGSAWAIAFNAPGECEIVVMIARSQVGLISLSLLSGIVYN